MKYLSAMPLEELKGIAILRLDLNTEDDSRLKASLPTLELLSKTSAKIVVLSHKGRPSGPDPALSLKSASEDIKKLLNKEVVFIPLARPGEINFGAIKTQVNSAPNGSIFLLENLRFLPSEEADDESLAKDLASLGNFYVNDAFAVSHRANASVRAITKFLPSYAGLELEKEITNLSKVMQNPAHPFVLILGGAKADDKLAVIEFLKDKMDFALLGGIPANTLLKLKGVDVKESIVAENAESFRKFLDMKQIILPIDWKEREGKILDIGGNTVNEFLEKIKGAKTIVWNGPLGLIENAFMREGTEEVAKAIAQNQNAFSVAGGGETVAFLEEMGFADKISFVSTGGGAMLEFLAGKELPGIKALEQ
jgi:phosphoglycerate kinase